MRDFIKILFMIGIVYAAYIYRTDISNYITDTIIYRGSNKVLNYNEYYIDNDYLYVQNKDDNSIKSYQDLLNIFYSIINSGDDNFTFNCDYDGCINDVKKLTDSQSIVSDINNFVHPFNSFSSINVDISNSGKINVKTKKIYSENEMEYIKSYVNLFIQNELNDGMSNYEKIKKFHDYIINNTEYDRNTSSNSYTAYNLITTGKAICGGYSDIMAVYLNILGIKNYRIASENHIWNLIYLDGVWYHLDMTWDDPVASDGKQYLIHNYFLITTDELLKLDNVEHNFDKNIYMEAK